MSDGQLLARFGEHRDELAEIAFAALVQRHGPLVLRVCRQILGDRHTAEDAFQATFLILARRASSIRQPALLGNWLHGVALRTAREARMRENRRRRREAPGADRIGAERIGEVGRPERVLACREEFEALHEEVSRLPERYRAPVVLCELEGLTYQEAALRLRCPVGTIGVRLRRARERLRLTLTRRGLAPTAGLIGALLGAEAASGSIPRGLVESTARAATRFAPRGAAAAGLVSPAVAALTEAVLSTMVLSPLRLGWALALAIAIASTIGWIGAHRKHEVPLRAEDGSPRSLEEAEVPGARSVAGLAKPRPNDQPRSPASSAGFPPAVQPIQSQTGSTQLALLSMMSQLIGKLDGKRKELIKELDRRKAKSDGEVARGAALFVKEWVPSDAQSHGGDGLGPVYNDTSCVACHGLASPGGAGPEGKNVVIVTATRPGQGAVHVLEQIHPGFHSARSVVLHRYGTDPEYGAWRARFLESHRHEQSNVASTDREDVVPERIRVLVEQTTLDRRMRDRSPGVRSINGFTISLSERNTPALFGAGLIDAVASEVLVAAAARQPANVRGRVGRTADGAVGRFGWKAQVAKLHEFVRGACANELGLEVPGHAQAASPLAPALPAKGLDMTERDCDALTAYVRALPAPVVVDPAGALGNEHMRLGRTLLGDLGCTSCHVPTLGNVSGIYSDLLLHDMGQSLSDSGSSYGIEGPVSPGGPMAGEWRTPPLWGYRDSGPYLHDGRAENLEEAVASHGGQATASARRFFELSSEDRAHVETFLKSLVAPPAPTIRGVVRAATLESQFREEAERTPESIVRRRWDEAKARGEQQRREEARRRHTLEAAKRARTRFPIARALEKKGKISGALKFYREIVHDAPATGEARLAAARIAALSARDDLLKPSPQAPDE
jgi:RNA polymerase sigma factor (sigma-70 family)